MLKKGLLCSIIMIASFTLITGCGCEKKEKEKEKEVAESKIIENKNKDVVKDQELDVFKFTNTSLKYDEGKNESTLLAQVKNTSDSDEKLDYFTVSAYQNDELLVTLDGYVGDIIKAGETKPLEIVCPKDLTKATRIEYTIKR